MLLTHCKVRRLGQMFSEVIRISISGDALLFLLMRGKKKGSIPAKCGGIKLKCSDIKLKPFFNIF